jgi:hypothetical protein
MPLLSNVELTVRHSPASKDVNVEAEGATKLVAVTRPRPVKTEQVEKTVCAVVNCRV